MDEAELAGAPPSAESGDKEIGGHLVDFLFAAQDASTFSLLWAICLLESHPEVLDRVRAEVASLWSPPEDDIPWPRITAEMLREMKYTEAVAREVGLRHVVQPAAQGSRRCCRRGGKEGRACGMCNV